MSPHRQAASRDAGTERPAAGTVEPVVPVREALLGALGSTLVMLGSFGAGSLDGLVGPASLDRLRFLAVGASGLATTMLVWAGVVLLVLAWLGLGGRLRAGADVRWRWVLAAWMLPLLPALPVFSADAFSYLAQGQTLGTAVDPYLDGPGTAGGGLAHAVHPDWRYTTTPYGALHLVLMAAIAGVSPSSPWLAVVALRLVVLACVGGLAVLLPRCAALAGVPRSRALWLGVANPLVVVHLVGGLHNDTVIYLCVVAAVLCAGRAADASLPPRVSPRTAWALLAAAGVLVGLAASIKVTSVVALPFLAWLGGRKVSSAFLRGAWMTALAALTCAAVTAASGTGFGWISALSVSDRVVYWISLPTASAHVVSFLGIAGFEDALSVTRLVGEGLLVLGVLAAWWWARPAPETGTRVEKGAAAVPAPPPGASAAARASRVSLGLALAWTAVFVANVVSWPWYWVVVLGALATSRTSPGRDRWLVSGTVGGTCVLLAAADPAGAPTLYRASFLVGTLLLAGAASLWAHRHRLAEGTGVPG